jgi:DNA transformation protein
MFGGAGVFANGLMFGLIVKDTLYLKADAETSSQFSELGLKPFEYRGKSGKPVSLGYFTAPPQCLEDPSEMASWARKSHSAALRASTKNTRRPKD